MYVCIMYVCTFHSAWVLFNIMFTTGGQLGIHSQDRVTWSGAHRDACSASLPCADISQGAPMKQARNSVHLQVFRALVKRIPKVAASPGKLPAVVRWGRVGSQELVLLGCGLSLSQALPGAPFPMKKVMAKLRLYQSRL